MMKKFSFENIKRFYERADLNKTCPCCGDNGWIIHTPDEDEYGNGFVSHIPMSKANLAAQKINGLYVNSHVVIATECSACGYMRFNSIATVMKWLDENPPKEDAPNV